VSRSVFEENTLISGTCSQQKAPEHGICGCHFKGSACNRELSHLQLSTLVTHLQVSIKPISPRSAEHTLVLQMLHCFLLLIAEHALSHMLR